MGRASSRPRKPHVGGAALPSWAGRDEKSQIQALDRTQPGLPLKKGRCGTLTHGYKRNGTATLFAAPTMKTQNPTSGRPRPVMFWRRSSALARRLIIGILLDSLHYLELHRVGVKVFLSKRRGCGMARPARLKDCDSPVRPTGEELRSAEIRNTYAHVIRRNHYRDGPSRPFVGGTTHRSGYEGCHH